MTVASGASKRPRNRPSAPPFDKRIVLLVTSGPFAGLRQINGTVSQARAELGALPEFLESVSMPPDQRRAPVGLVAYKHRYVLYKEIYGPPAQTYESMDPRQQ